MKMLNNSHLKIFRYRHESLLEKRLIDDNSLYLFYQIYSGVFCENENVGKTYAYVNSVPIEWNNLDVIKFIILVAIEYEIPITKIESGFFPAEDELKEMFGEDLCVWAEEFIKEAEPFDVELQKACASVLNKKLDLYQLMYVINWVEFGWFPISSVYSGQKEAQSFFETLLNYTNIGLDYQKKKLNNVKKDFNNYINSFIDGDLIKSNYRKQINGTSVNMNSNVFTYQSHVNILSSNLSKEAKLRGVDFTLFSPLEYQINSWELNSVELRERYQNREYLFFHALFSFQYANQIKITYIKSNWDFHEDRPLKYCAKIECITDTNTNSMKIHVNKFTYNTKDFCLHVDGIGKSHEIRGAQKKLIELFLKDVNLKCTKDKINQTFQGNVDAFSGAMRRLKLALSPIAKITTIYSEEDARVINYYKIEFLKNNS